MTQLKGSKFVTTVVLVFKKIESEDKTLNTFHSNSKAEIIINGSNIDDVFQSIYTTVISVCKNFSKYNPLAGSNYVKLPKELPI